MAEVKIVKFNAVFKPTEREYKDLETLIGLCDDLYPGIEVWYKKKVISGLNDNGRVAYLLYRDELPVGAAVLKRGENAKICSFRIIPEWESQGYGRLLMALIGRELRNNGKDFHFTIPEHVWSEKAMFFKDYGMSCTGPAKDQYRLFDRELYGLGDSNALWHRVVQTLPELCKDILVNGIKLNYDLVMSMHPNYARAVVRGQKSVEIRRQFSDRWVGSHTLVYSTSPENSFVGSFRISRVLSGPPSEIWETFGPELGCSKETFNSYTAKSERVFAIVISESSEFKEPMLRSRLSHLVKKDIKAPQSYAKFQESSALEEALSIQTLFQSTL